MCGINAEDIIPQLAEEHGSQEAYQVALKGAAETVKSYYNFSFTFKREVKAAMRSKIGEQINATEPPSFGLANISKKP